MKRIMCLLLALVMVFSLVGVSAFAEEDDGEGTASAQAADEETGSGEAAEGETAVLTASLDDGSIPVTVTGATEGLYYAFDYDSIYTDSWYGVYLKAGYDIEVTGGTLDVDFYDIDSDGTVFRYRDFIVYGDSAPDEVVINVVASSDEAPTAVYVTTQLPSGATADIIDYGNYDTYVLSGESDNICLIGAYKVSASAGIEVTDYWYSVDEESGTLYSYYEYTVTGETSEAALNIVENPDAPTVVLTAVKLPDGASAEDVIVDWPSYYNEYTLSGYSDYIELCGGYALGETAGIEITDSWYWVGSEGQVYAYYWYILTGETSEVALNIVEDEDAPYAIKITYAGDLADEYTTEYMLSTDEYAYQWFPYSYELTSVTNATVKTGYEGANGIEYYLYPDEGATEIVVTGTKKAAGTLKVTGATEQVVSIQKWVSVDEQVDVAEGDVVEVGDILFVTVEQGYAVDNFYSRDSVDNNQSFYQVYVRDILADGIATLNVAEGAVVAYAGDVENGKQSGNGSLLEGATVGVGATFVVYTNYGYVVDVDGGEITEDTYYYCNSETGQVYGVYIIEATSTGTLTVTFREAEEGDLPTAIKVTYTGKTDGLRDVSYGNDAYVLPGDYFELYLEDGYTAEVTGATYVYYYSDRNVDFTIDEDATAVTVNIIKIAEESTLKVVGGTDVTDAEAQEAVIKTDDTVADGDALESGRNTIRVANGYEIEAVDGAVYYENGYVTDYDGNIYLEYVLVPTGDPAEVTITVGLVVEWVTVNLVNNTEYFAYTYSDNMKTTDSGKQCLSTDTIYVSVYGGNTIKVTGGTVVTSKVYSDSSYFEIEINEGVTEVTVEIISVDDLTTEQAELGYIDSTNDPAQQGSSSGGGTGTGTGSATEGGTGSGSGSGSGSGTGSGSGSGSGTAPSTGDETSVTLWAILTAALAAATGAVLTLAKKKNN
ncbi:MAG: hypothetical protein LUG57_09520 [Oscillospiraceae bacterium]|nr:hypothetical protein [Oscillospiraceae bacterium]